MEKKKITKISDSKQVVNEQPKDEFQDIHTQNNQLLNVEVQAILEDSKKEFPDEIFNKNEEILVPLLEVRKLESSMENKKRRIETIKRTYF